MRSIGTILPMQAPDFMSAEQKLSILAKILPIIKKFVFRKAIFIFNILPLPSFNFGLVAPMVISLY